MTGRKRLGTFILIGGIVFLAAAGVLWRGDAGRRSEMAAEATALQDSAKNINRQVQAVNLKYRAFRETQSQAPDSVRQDGVEQMAIGQSYNKTIRKLEMAERDVRLQVSALKRKTTEERAEARRRAIPAAAAGGAALLLGSILLLSGRRVGA
jgi:ribosomal protein S1